MDVGAIIAARASLRAPIIKNKPIIVVPTKNPKVNAPEVETSSFPNFPLFPCDIRAIIWSYSIFRPRLVELKRAPHLSHPEFPISTTLIACVTLPPALQICSETRRLALLRYIYTSGPIQLFLNPEIDTLYFGPQVYLNTLYDFMHTVQRTADWARVKRIAIDDRELIKFTEGGALTWIPQWDKEKRIFHSLSTLEELIVVFSSGHKYERKFLGGDDRKGHCADCRGARREIGPGIWGWRFPLFKEFANSQEMVQQRPEYDVYVMETKEIIVSQLVRGIPTYNIKSWSSWCLRHYVTVFFKGLESDLFSWYWKWMHGIAQNEEIQVPAETVARTNLDDEPPEYWVMWSPRLTWGIIEDFRSTSRRYPFGRR